MKPVFLIGYMGSGKSTLGRLVSKATGKEFIDLDQYIENRFHRSIAQLFDEHGESGFREIERSLLHEVGEIEDVIIACGGGTPCFFDNIDYINRAGTAVLLEAPLEILHARLLRGKHKRPLIASLNSEELREFIRTSLEKRNTYYRKAMYRFDTASLEKEKDREETARSFIETFMS